MTVSDLTQGADYLFTVAGIDGGGRMGEYSAVSEMLTLDGMCMFCMSQSKTLSGSGTGWPVCKPVVQFWNWITIIVTLTLNPIYLNPKH